MGVSKNRGVYPPKWMVSKIMETPMDDLGGFYTTPIFGGKHPNELCNLHL